MSVRLVFARSFSMIRLVTIFPPVPEIFDGSICFTRDPGQQLFIFVAQRSPVQQVGPVTPRFFKAVRGASGVSLHDCLRPGLQAPAIPKIRRPG
jgi:hypothetical protein